MDRSKEQAYEFIDEIGQIVADDGLSDSEKIEAIEDLFGDEEEQEKDE